MRLAVLTRYGRRGASSRIRMLQFAPALRSRRLEPSFHPLFDDTYLERLYSGGLVFRPVLRAYVRRLGQLLGARRAQAIWLEKEALPWVPAALELGIVPRNVPLVSDYDDAVFHRYDLHAGTIVRRLLGRKIDQVMANSALVTAGNAYLADRARAAGARRVEIVPSVVDLAQYKPRIPAERDTPPVIGWIGSPSTWQDYLRPMLPLLVEVAEKYGARIVIVGSGARSGAHPLVEVVPWTEEDEVAQIRWMDIGIMPLDDTPWARGKCGYKLIQYMACGLPVVASRVGANAEVVEDGIQGLLVGDAKEWRAALASLLRDPHLRARMGAEGRRRVEERYSTAVWGPRVADLLRDVAAGG